MKSYIIFLILISFLLVGCGKSTPDNVIFLDNFNGDLDEGWNWANEDPNRWELIDEEGGWLIITADNSSMLHQSEIIGQTNVLVRTAPEGDYILETKLNSEPKEDFQQAGIYMIEDGFDYVAILISFCQDCMPESDGHIIEMKAVRDNLPLLESPYIARHAPSGKNVYLRLVFSAQDNAITGYYRFHPDEWTEAFRVDNAPPFDKVGLGVTNSPGPNGVQQDLVAMFSYFELSREEAPASP
ncbi:MAG: hypothetical protein U9R58_16075 [Chloroflexota bacterium]|nr:hypothetical protein [Chloroflexota bacterium]